MIFPLPEIQSYTLGLKPVLITSFFVASLGIYLDVFTLELIPGDETRINSLRKHWEKKVSHQKKMNSSPNLWSLKSHLFSTSCNMAQAIEHLKTWICLHHNKFEGGRKERQKTNWCGSVKVISRIPSEFISSQILWKVTAYIPLVVFALWGGSRIRHCWQV